MEINKSLKLKLVLGKPFIFGNELIKQPTINTIDIIGEETFMAYLQPYALTMEVINLPEELKKDYAVFDIFFIIDMISEMQHNYSEETSILNLVKSSFHYFFDTENVVLNKDNMEFIINDRTIINKTNFDALADLILLMCKTNKIKDEKKEMEEYLKDKSEDFKRRYLRHLENRRRYLEKNKSEDGLYKIINTVVHYQENINYDVGNLTFWQLINSYETLVNREKYKYNISLLSVMSEDGVKKLDLQHWSEKFKIEPI